MDLKHTTKAELYEMLCEEQKKREAAEAIMEKQAEHAKELERSLAALRDLAAKQNQQNAEAVQLAEDIKEIAKGYHKALRWCIEHPWKNLWKCLTGADR